jgi:hypothetical protein
MSAELDALSHKLDVPSRAKEKVGAASRRVKAATPTSGDMKSAANDNPLGIVIGGAAIGLLAGLLLPRTRVEDERLGPLADTLRDEVVAAGREAAERGKSVAKRAGEAAVDASKSAANSQGRALKTTAQERAQKVAANSR